MSELVEDEGETSDKQITSESETDSVRDHLDGLEGGAGCAEIWERLSEQRTDD
jgi:hypothetical protein